MKITHIYNSKIPKLLKVDAITLYPLILYAYEYPTPPLIEHEMVHVKQIQKIGVVRFYISYLLYYFAGRLEGKTHLESYRSIPFEVEAYNIK